MTSRGVRQMFQISMKHMANEIVRTARVLTYGELTPFCQEGKPPDLLLWWLRGYPVSRFWVDKRADFSRLAGSSDDISHY